MSPLEQFFNLFITVDPISIVVTLIAGAIWALIFHDWEIDKRTLFLALGFYAPFLVGRLLYVLTAGTVVGSGYIGIFYILLYFVGAALTRKVLRGKISDR